MLTRRVTIASVLAVSAACAGCSSKSRPELVALKDASVYADTPVELVDAEDRVEIAIAGVRVVEGGALVDVIMSVRPERRNRIDKALEIITGGPDDEFRIAKGNLESAATMDDPVRLTGPEGPVRLSTPRLNREDPEAEHWGYLWMSLIRPKSAEFTSNGRTYVVQPVAIATRGPLKSGMYTVELTEHFMWWIVRPPRGEVAPTLSAQVRVDAPAALPAPSLLDF